MLCNQQYYSYNYVFTQESVEKFQLTNFENTILMRLTKPVTDMYNFSSNYNIGCYYSELDNNSDHRFNIEIEEQFEDTEGYIIEQTKDKYQKYLKDWEKFKPAHIKQIAMVYEEKNSSGMEVAQILEKKKVSEPRC